MLPLTNESLILVIFFSIYVWRYLILSLSQLIQAGEQLGHNPPLHLSLCILPLDNKKPWQTKLTQLN
jgi:hypothetical protein